MTHTAYNGSVFNTSLTSSDTLITQLWNQANDQSITVDLNLGTHSHRYSVNGVVNTVIYDSVYLFAPPNATAATASVPISLMTGLSEMCRLSGTTVVPPIFNSLLDGLTAFLNIK